MQQQESLPDTRQHRLWHGLRIAALVVPTHCSIHCVSVCVCTSIAAAVIACTAVVSHNMQGLSQQVHPSIYAMLCNVVVPNNTIGHKQQTKSLRVVTQAQSLMIMLQKHLPSTRKSSPDAASYYRER